MSRLTVAAVLLAAVVALTTSSAANPAAATHRTGTIAFIHLGNGGSDGQGLFVVRPDGSGLRRVTPAVTSVDSYAWSPDGNLIAYTDLRGSLWLVRPDGSGRRLLLLNSRFPSVDVSWSPDGTRVAIATGGPKGHPCKPCSARLRLYVVSIGGSHASPLPAGKHIGYGVSWSPR